MYSEIDKHEVIVIVGTEALGKLLFDVITYESSKTVVFADNNPQKNKAGILSSKLAVEKYPHALYICASEFYGDNMRDRLISLGVCENNIITKLPPLLIEQFKANQRQMRLTPQAELKRIEIDLTRHCNLSCAGCNAFSPLVKEEKYLDIESFEKDMSRLRELFVTIKNINLMGGEPLLHPQVDDFTSCARDIFPNTKITIVTNGILLPKMSGGFWRKCHEQDIRIGISKYPIEINEYTIKKAAQEYDVKIEWYGNSETIKNSHRYTFDVKGGQDPYESFTNCHLANNCVRLNKSKLSTCSLIVNIADFNEYFGTLLKVTDDDLVDIYEVPNGKEALRRLACPVPFCRYCDVKHRTYNENWHISKKTIDEWVYA